jgi:hypothetical protein
MSSGVRVPSEFAVHTVLEVILILDNHSQLTDKDYILLYTQIYSRS